MKAVLLLFSVCAIAYGQGECRFTKHWLVDSSIGYIENHFRDRVFKPSRFLVANYEGDEIRQVQIEGKLSVVARSLICSCFDSWPTLIRGLGYDLKFEDFEYQQQLCKRRGVTQVLDTYFLYEQCSPVKTFVCEIDFRF